MVPRPVDHFNFHRWSMLLVVNRSDKYNFAFSCFGFAFILFDKWRELMLIQMFRFCEPINGSINGKSFRIGSHSSGHGTIHG